MSWNLTYFPQEQLIVTYFEHDYSITPLESVKEELDSSNDIHFWGMDRTDKKSINCIRIYK